jgi:hypothetical protein
MSSSPVAASPAPFLLTSVRDKGWALGLELPCVKASLCCSIFLHIQRACTRQSEPLATSELQGTTDMRDRGAGGGEKVEGAVPW